MENYKAELDKRVAEKQRLEEKRRRENMEKLRRDMESSKGQTVVLSTGLKDDESKTKMVDNDDEEIDEEDEDNDDYDRFTEEDDAIDEDEDEEVARFSF
uniref:Uncharacterized protein n=1 Tax=Cucumis melo TaxID=3656 RepID=A0A9I9D484_CUCME